MTDQLSLTVRLATLADEDSLARLAALDSAPRLSGLALLAEVSDVAVAALSLEDGRVIADPFTRTEDAVAVLHVRAGHFASWLRPGARGWLLRGRLGLGHLLVGAPGR